MGLRRGLALATALTAACAVGAVALFSPWKDVEVALAHAECLSLSASDSGTPLVAVGDSLTAGLSLQRFGIDGGQSLVLASRLR